MPKRAAPKSDRAGQLDPPAETEDTAKNFAPPGKSPFKIQRVNVDLPQGIIDRLDHEAKYLGIARQALIKILLNDGILAREENRMRGGVQSVPSGRRRGSRARQAHQAGEE
jgi:hypothetical protein